MGWRRAGLMVAVGAVTVACNAAAYHAVALSADQLAGQWRSREGTVLTFHANGSFTSDGVPRLSAAERCGNRSDMSSGSWHFGSGVDEPVDRGAYLQLTFSGTDCRFPLFLFGEADDPVMCPTVGDPDAGCEYDEYLRRVVLAASP
ncbi:hypothetical protein [Streptomyces antarcticus]|uniref:hypothetical protein n=1 Tax=Streptomyces antarcticus TaxID=2996458 RepID=UPI00226EE5A5|nr:MULTISPECIES: hypothetical protein [unclassified Streptomyces]MCY0947837.1 hypothetical protein [Streptomyces sp. H34-AA3]MCZ4082189.1 hypothetical protein [Streptomyces sp. H34-S5]